VQAEIPEKKIKSAYR